MFTEHLEQLRNYQKMRWGLCPSSKWTSLCEVLRDYEVPCRSFVMNHERKWELVSALQKSIRRGDKKIALYLVSAMDSLPEEYAYFWRRLCVIACEDVGPADDVLASFVVACSTVFSPKKTGSRNYDVFCFLAERMCDLPIRSRIYCSYSMIEAAVTKGGLPDLEIEDRTVISAIMGRKAAVLATNSPWREWQRKNDWRAEGLLRFVGLTLPIEMAYVVGPIPPHRTLYGLPSYCYDMHTRVGLQVLHRLVRGVEGAEAIKELFRENKVESAHRVLGDALFFVEGGRIQGELIYEPLCNLEQRVSAYQYGISLDGWLHLRELASEALKQGVVDQTREEVLHQFYGGLFAIGLHNDV